MGTKRKIRRTSGNQKKKYQPTGTPPGQSQNAVILQQAKAHYRAGRFPEAEALYRQIIQSEQNNADALNWLGKLAHQAGNGEKAVTLIGKALVSRPDYLDAHINMGIVLTTLGRLEEAVASYRQALVLKPDFAEVHNNLGNVLKEQGKLDEAVASYRKALTLKPDFSQMHYNLARTLKAKGKLDEAAISYQQAIALMPDYPDAYNNLGNVFRDQGKLDEAIDSFCKALSLKPNFIEAQNNLGLALKNQGKLEEAVASYRQALSLKPDYAEVHYNLGNVLKEQGKLDEAIASYCKALSLKPDYIEAHTNLGLALRDQGKLDEAIASYRKALSLKPDFVEAHTNLGGSLRDQGKLDEAIACFREAIALRPDFLDARINLLFCLNLLPEQPVSQYLDEAHNYGRKVSEKVNSHFSNWHCSLTPDRLRIGMVSGDLRNHPVGYFLENILGNIDPAQMELIAYSTHYEEDALSTRIRPYFTEWKSLLGMPDETAARLIRDDGVHILLDLSGHTLHNRLPVFAWKPAPVQATWLGYFASTGIAEIDYLIADPVSIPESFQEHFTEKIWYLPETRLCFSPPVTSEELPVMPLPALRNGYITFGCFQKLAKLNDKVLAVWGEIFRLLPQARLRLQNHFLNSTQTRDQMQQRLGRIGIAPERLTFEEKAPRIEYLEAHAHVDIILDTFPFPGGTTTCEALWMGVPTMTLSGQTMLGRQGASILSCAGLDNWIAKDEREYVAKVVAHESDLERLARLRAGLRQRVLASPLYDSSRFAKNLDAAMWGMWRRFREGIE